MTKLKFLKKKDGKIVVVPPHFKKNVCVPIILYILVFWLHVHQGYACLVPKRPKTGV